MLDLRSLNNSNAEAAKSTCTSPVQQQVRLALDSLHELPSTFFPSAKLTAELYPRSLQGFAFESYVRPIYSAVEKRLTAQDQDQEVKESAIIATGLVISILGDKLQSELPTSLNLLLDRLRNEITRLTAVKVGSPGNLGGVVCEGIRFVPFEANWLQRRVSAEDHGFVGREHQQVSCGLIEATVSVISVIP